MTGIEWIALAGIFGTLAGTALGAWISWRINAANLKQQERMLFHTKRLEVYASYLAAVNALVAAFHLDGSWDLEQGAEAIRQFGVLQLVATEPVRRAATEVQAIVAQINSAVPPDQAPFIQHFLSISPALLQEMRAEIGVGTPSHKKSRERA